MNSFFKVDVDSKRVFGLDFLRAFAIFCVLHGHAGAFLDDTSLEVLTKIPIPHGVDIFFIMSGFLIGNSFISYVEKNDNRMGGTKIFNFYARTALRILPNYFFILLANYFLVRLHVIQGNTEAFPVWRFVTFTQNLITPFWEFYWESWSLPVQWWFYIFFPLFMMFFCLVSKPKRFIPWLCVFFVLFSIIYRFSVAEMVNGAFMWDVWIRKTVASRIDNIYIGVLAVWTMHYFRNQWDRHAVKCLVIGIVLFFVSRLIPHKIGSFYYDIVYLTLSAVAIALWLPFITRYKIYKTAVGGFVSRISILSYSMFLTNLLAVEIMTCQFHDFIKNHGIIAYFVFWPIVFAASYLLHILVEKPFMQIRKHL